MRHYYIVGYSCLGMVDFWTESVLIGKENDDNDTTNSRSCQCGLVDWEYFGVSSAASELGMFRKLFLCLTSSKKFTLIIF